MNRFAIIKKLKQIGEATGMTVLDEEVYNYLLEFTCDSDIHKNFSLVKYLFKDKGILIKVSDNLDEIHDKFVLIIIKWQNTTDEFLEYLYLIGG